jgi:hypothetical protein
LVMMNDPQVNEAARVLAESLMAESIEDADRISKAFRLIICRKASEKERGILEKYFNTEKKNFETNIKAAEDLIAIGEYKHRPTNDRAGLAAMIEVIMTIYNMEEAIVKS